VSNTAPPEEKGKALYAVKGCVACHSIDGKAGVGPTWAGLYGRAGKASGADYVADDAYITQSIREPGAKIVDGYPPAMPPYALSDDEITSLIAYIKTLK
jgi:cytochrome c oxidase subunit 2